MPAISAKDMGAGEFLPSKIDADPKARCVPRSVCMVVSSFLGLVLLLTCSFGCAPRSSSGNGVQGQPDSTSNDMPEITEQTIRERINGAHVGNVPEENGAGEPIGWNFHESEPKELAVVDKQMNGTHATLLLDIKTRTSPNARTPRSLAGEIRTEWELQTGWVLRRWEIVRTENISMKYKNLPKEPPNNPDR
ncbi:MAG TPA: hypothetical protein VLI65_10300 [Pyrinomonadaceae bacterium]|nr:hypothetical protein [Pyrinomonadaceae bacterium]